MKERKRPAGDGREEAEDMDRRADQRPTPGRPIDTEALGRAAARGAPGVVLVEDELVKESPFGGDRIGEEVADFVALDADENADEVLDEIGRYTLDEDVLDEFADRQRLAYGSDELAARLRGNPQDSPEVAADDIDADWERSAVGEELPGGSVATPDQDVVDEIGQAVGLTYQDDEPLGGADKVEERDQDRWELNPASAEADPTLGIRFDVEDMAPGEWDKPVVGRGLDLEDDDWALGEPGEDELEPYEEALDEIDDQIEDEDGVVP